jgi:LacI family transcriptional regulator
MDDLLWKWEPRARQALAELLRHSVKPYQGHEELLWEELLKRLEQSGDPLSPDEAAGILNLADTPSVDEIVNQTASRLRAKLRDTAKTFDDDFGVYINKRTYAICVTKAPPKEWKRTVGPSIGLLLADAADWFVGDLIRGATEVCNSRGYDLLVEVSNGDSRTEARKLQHILQRADGALIVPVAGTSPDSRLLLHEHACVLIDRYLADSGDVCCVHHDDVSAGRQAALYLKEFGCERILIVDQGSRLEDKFAITPLADRIRGCKLQLEGDRTKVRSLPVVGCDEQGGFDALEFFEKKQPLLPTDGIFALTDKLALGCRHYLNSRNPKLDLPLIGAEGQAFGDFLDPPLASIFLDTVEVGRRSAALLISKLQKDELPGSSCPLHVLIPPSLLIASPISGKREKRPIAFPDAATHYSERT